LVGSCYCKVKLKFLEATFVSTSTYFILDGNRETTTLLECVSASNKVLKPLIIFKGKQHQRSWYNSGDKEGAFFAVSNNGWTNNSLGLYWIQYVFDAQTKDQAGSGYRLLLLDGHSSHSNYSFLEYCINNRIIPFCMPSHSTHDLQPLDVGIFGPYAIYYGQEVDTETRKSHGILNINKNNFWSLLKRARAKTFISTTISSGWKQSGLWPFNPRVVYARLPGEHTPDPIPIPSSSPTSVVVPTTPRSIRKLTTKVIKNSNSTQHKRMINRLSSTIEHLLVDNELFRKDLIEVKKALQDKPRRNQKKLVGPGAFELEHLIKMKEALEEKERDKAAKKGKGRAQNQATSSKETPTDGEDMDVESEGSDEEEYDCIVVEC
jgi:hypothetical protein